MVDAYVKNNKAYECPSDRGLWPGSRHEPAFAGRNFFEHTGTSYSYNTGSWHINTPIPYPMTGQVAIPLVLQSWGVWGRHVDNTVNPSKQVVVAEWSFYWLIQQENYWDDGREFVLHGALGRTPDKDVVRMNLVFVDGHGEFVRLRHNYGNIDHYINEDYEYTTAPLP